MTCSAYPLTALDTIRPDGSTSWRFVIDHLIKFVIVYLLTLVNSFTKKGKET